MNIEFKHHKNDKNDTPLFLAFFNGERLSATRFYRPEDCSESSFSYAEFHGYIQGMKDMLSLTGGRALGNKVTYEFESLN